MQNKTNCMLLNLSGVESPRATSSARESPPELRSERRRISSMARNAVTAPHSSPDCWEAKEHEPREIP